MQTTTALLLFLHVAIANAATCSNTDGASTAFSADRCVAVDKLRKFNWADATCAGSVCATSDCCVGYPDGLGTLTNQVALIDEDLLHGAYAVTVSPDGNNVYALGYYSNSIVHYDRDASTGKLTEKFSELGDYTTDLAGVCGLTVSPDGKNVYAVTTKHPKPKIVRWDRDLSTGVLTNKVWIFEPALPHGVTVSPDGKNVYAVGTDTSKIVWWDRDSSTGGLTNRKELTPTDKLDGGRSVTVSPDGKNVYAVAESSHSIVHWDRDASTGGLTEQVAVIDTTNLNGAYSVSVSPDGKNVYVAAKNSRSIVYWDRDASTGKLTNKIVIDDNPNLHSVSSVIVSPDGKNVYAVAGRDIFEQNSKSIVHWNRNAATGALTNKAVLIDKDNLNGAGSVAMSPDGKNIYAVAWFSKSIVHWNTVRLPSCVDTDGSGTPFDISTCSTGYAGAATDTPGATYNCDTDDCCVACPKGESVIANKVCVRSATLQDCKDLGVLKISAPAVTTTISIGVEGCSMLSGETILGYIDPADPTGTYPAGMDPSTPTTLVLSGVKGAVPRHEIIGLGATAVSDTSRLFRVQPNGILKLNSLRITGIHVHGRGGVVHAEGQRWYKGNKASNGQLLYKPQIWIDDCEFNGQAHEG